MGAGRLSRKDFVSHQMLLRRVAERQAKIDCLQKDLAAVQLLLRPEGSGICNRVMSPVTPAHTQSLTSRSFHHNTYVAAAHKTLACQQEVPILSA